MSKRIDEISSFVSNMFFAFSLSFVIFLLVYAFTKSDFLTLIAWASPMFFVILRQRKELWIVIPEHKEIKKKIKIIDSMRNDVLKEIIMKKVSNKP